MKRTAEDVGEEAKKLRYNYYVEHKRTAAMSDRRVESFRKKHSITVSSSGGEEENVVFRPVTKFKRSGMPKAFIREVCKSFDRPSPIQAQCWPLLLSGHDVIGIAKTGSGKTIAFGLPGLVHVSARGKAKPKKPFMLVLAPTRELAVQTEQVCEAAGKHCDPVVKTVCVFGGVSKEPQKKALLEGAQIVVATPGRLMDLMQEGAIDLSCVSYVVLDEADRMLDLGFMPDLQKILPKTMKDRQTAMFSATWPSEVRTLASTFLSKAVRVTVGSVELEANIAVKQIVEVMEPSARTSRLLALLKEQMRDDKSAKILVFVLYKKEAVFVEQLLRRTLGQHACAAIHGDLSQAQRDTVLANFKSGKCPLMIATDVAARGLDVPDIVCVINYSFPLTIEDYVHRIGRTGRAGKGGVAYTLFTSNEKALAGSLAGVLRKAGEEIPEGLDQWGMGVKRRKHSLYGLHFRDDIETTAKHTVFKDSDDDDDE